MSSLKWLEGSYSRIACNMIITLKFKAVAQNYLIYYSLTSLMPAPTKAYPRMTPIFYSEFYNAK
ncbi:MAG: hypothetical protein HOM96_00610 [Rickettsiales bacterium]|nr:hypothetical protein [Rickettsiales bacterium]